MNARRIFKVVIVTVLVCCGASILADTNMYPITADDKAFFENIQKAVSKEDIGWLSEAIDYPFVVGRSSEKLKLNNASDFKKHSAAILTKELKAAVQKQSPDDLFKTWRGLMIGDGVIWFSQTKKRAEERWRYRIIAINP